VKIVFMVGNGLDLHLGLKTRYADFYSRHKGFWCKVYSKFTQGECILYHELKLEVFR